MQEGLLVFLGETLTKRQRNWSWAFQDASITNLPAKILVSSESQHLQKIKTTLPNSSTILVSEKKNMEFPGLGGFMTKDPAADDPGHKCWLYSKFNYPKFLPVTPLPVPGPFLIIIFPGPSTPTRVSEPKFKLLASSELRINAEGISSEGGHHVLFEE